MDTSIVVAIFVVIGIFLYTTSNRRRQTDDSGGMRREKAVYHYERKSSLMTRSEIDFYQLLNSMYGSQCHIFPQIHLSALVNHKIPNHQNWNAALRHINSKSVDYVLCDREALRPLVAIELDDWSHDRADRQARDQDVERIFAEVGLPLVRITEWRKTDSQQIRDQINAALISQRPNAAT